jgi:hypothetical protein
VLQGCQSSRIAPSVTPRLRVVNGTKGPGRAFSPWPSPDGMAHALKPKGEEVCEAVFIRV